MFKKKLIIAIAVILLFSTTGVLAQSLEDNWNDFLHYTKIARLDLAKDYAQVVLNSNPDPVELLSLSEANPRGYAILLKANENPHDTELAELSSRILDIIEQGRFIRRTDPKIIVAEIKRLSSTDRARLEAVKRLNNAGEHAIMYMLDVMDDQSRKNELPNIIWALPQIGKDAIRPLAAALQTENLAVKAEIIKAMGAIEYPQSLAYLKYVYENDNSEELKALAKTSIEQINSTALKLSAAELFYRLAEDYYYHAESLEPAEDADFANIWFWDKENQRLYSEKVDKSYFNELMAMRTCEWSLKANPGFGKAIGLWIASYFKAENAGINPPDNSPEYFGPGHADASTYASTAGPEYLHQALARAVEDKDAYVALGAVEALATTAGEKSLLYRLGTKQPLVQALSFNDRAVRYSAAIAIAAAGPEKRFPESKLVIENLAQALAKVAEPADQESPIWSQTLADSYALRSVQVLLKLAETQNRVIDLSAAQSVLIDTTKKSIPQLQILSGRVLAYLDSPDAQRSITAMALTEANAMDIRISAFNSLAISAKFNANLLDVATIDAIYSLVSSEGIDPKLRSAGAAAYGSLNLPSRKVKDLILDQARS